MEKPEVLFVTPFLLINWFLLRSRRLVSLIEIVIVLSWQSMYYLSLT